MKFLVPVDFTEITNPLLRIVKAFAQAHSAEVDLLHVVSPVLYLPYPESFGMATVDMSLLTELQERQKEKAKEKLEGLVEFLKPLKASLYVEVGDPAEVILEKESAYDLIFVGSHKKGLVQRILIGSTTEKVVKYSHKPVFILKGREPEKISNVLIGYDFSEYANKALSFALNLLKPFSPHIFLVHVEETIELPLVEGIRDVLSQRYREEKERHIKELERRIKEEGFEVESYILEDRSPADGIKRFLKEKPNMDLVVLGSRGLSGLKRVLLGSTSSELMKGLEIPMLIHRSLE
ncbi:MAG: universal stress protein [Aquificota bacterium]|jgi:nucleotide-binding universal stress UspA family protein